MKNFYKVILFIIGLIPSLLFSQSPGTSCSNPIPIYPGTTCNNSCGLQYCGYYSSESGDAAMVAMTGSSSVNPGCTTDNETTQKVEWLEITATATSFTLSNQTNYSGPGASTAEKRDYVVYSGTCASLTQVACFTEVAGGGGTAVVTGLTPGQTYLVMVSQSATSFAASSTYTAVATCVTSSTPFNPPNNACSGATALTTNVPYESTNANSTADGPSVCQSPASGSVENNVWFSWCAPAGWTPGQPAFLTVSSQICNSTQGLQLSVYGPNPNCASVAAGTATSVLCQNPGVTTDYSYTFTPVAGDCYLINLDGYAGTSCTFLVQVGTTSVTCVPPTIAVNSASICGTGSVSLVASGATSYTWSPATGLSSTSGATVTANPTVTTVYTILGSQAGCTGSKQTTVTVNPIPTTTASTTGTLTCSTTTVALNSTLAGANYTWTAPVGGSVGSANTQSTSASGAIGTYTLNVQSAAGCTYSTTTTVTQNTTAPTVTVTPATQTITCASPTVTMIGSATPSSCTPVWTGGVATGANSYTATATFANTYTLTVTNPVNGCTVSATSQVMPTAGTPSVNTSVTNSLSCTTLTAQVVATTTASPVTYNWTGPGVTAGATTASATVNAGGQYTVVVTNTVSSCSTTSFVTVIQNTTAPTTSASTTGTLTCSTLTVALTSTLSGMSYTWTAPVGGSVASANTQSTSASGAAGTYTIKVVNPINGCTYTTTTAVTQNTTAPTVTITPSTQTITCGSPTVTMVGSATPSSCTPVWMGGVASGVNSYTATATTANIYTLTVTNPANSCTAIATTNISQNITPPSVTTSATNSLSCTSLTAQVVATTAASPVSYNWTGSGITAGATTASATVNASGQYTVVVTNTVTSCSTTTFVTVTQNTTVPTVTITPATQTITCASPTVTMIGSATPSSCTPVWTGGVASGANSYTATATAANIYTLTVTNPANSCTAIATTNISQNITPPAVTTSASNSLSCTSLTAQVIATTAASPVSYSWSGPGVTAGATTASATANAGGQYTVVVTNTITSCSTTTFVTVTQNTTAPTGVSAGSNQTLGCGSSSVVTLNGSVGTPTNATASWSGPSISGSTTSFTTTANGAGTYTLVATNPANGCTSFSTVVVNPSAGAPSLTMNPVTNSITCTNTLVTVSITSTVSPATYAWSGTGIESGNGTGTITVSQGGTFNYTLTNTTNSCSASGSTVVAQNNTTPTTTASTTGMLTCTNTSVDLSANPATYNYTWTAPVGGTLGTPTSSATTASGAAGIYTLNVLNTANNCTFTTTVNVTQNVTTPTTTASSNGTLNCVNNDVDLITSPTLSGMNYTWTAPTGGTVTSTSSQTTVAHSAPGDYTLSISDPTNGCTYTTTAFVPQNITPPSGLSAGANQTLTCPTNSVALTGTITSPSNATYMWTGPSICGTPTTIATDACQDGVYTLTAIDPNNGCPATATVNVAPNAGAPSPTISATAVLLDCNNTVQTVTVTSDVTDVTYSWNSTPSSVSTDNSVATFTAVGTSTYICTVTNTLSNCTSSVQVVVTQDIAQPVTTPTVTGMLTCTNHTVDLGANISSMNYTWTAPVGGTVGTYSTETTTAMDVAGDYSLTVQNPTNGCTYSTVVTVSENITPPSGFTAGSDQTLPCVFAPVTLTGTAGTPVNATLLWTGPSICATATTTDITTSACGAGTYTLTVTDPSNGCTVSPTVNVMPSAGAPNPSITANALTIDCINTVQTVTVTSDIVDVAYSWSPLPASVSSDNSVATFTAAPTTTYICTVTNTLNGCSSNTLVVVTLDNAQPTITSITGTQTLTCAAPVLTITAAVTPTNVTYVWSSTASIVSGQGTSDIVVNQPDDYTVTVTAANGCTATASSSVIPSSGLPSASIIASTNSVITCSNPSVTLTAVMSPTSSAYTYAWSTLSNNSSITATNSGTYAVLVTNTVTGCQVPANITVTDNLAQPTVTVSNVTMPCGVNSTTLLAQSSATNFSWATSGTGNITGGGTTDMPTVSSAGNYTVTVTESSNGCSTSSVVTVTQLSGPTAAFTADPTSGTAPLAVNFSNQTTGTGNTYSWNFGDNSANTSVTSPAYVYSVMGTYVVTLTATDAAGVCSSTQTLTIQVFENSVLVIPNVFTPNADGSNDVFKIVSTGIKDLNCDIFNRWGTKIKTISSINDSWDGTGSSDGTYFFILKATGYDGKEFSEHGYINLFR